MLADYFGNHPCSLLFGISLLVLFCDFDFVRVLALLSKHFKGLAERKILVFFRVSLPFLAKKASWRVSEDTYAQRTFRTKKSTALETVSFSTTAVVFVQFLYRCPASCPCKGKRF